ncbi:hypothetical protein B0H19DRAFT_1224302, partial [Mycena capillaripes]
MDTIPQELVGAIVGQIGDNESLKMCSLVSRMFRDPSQRILLYSLALGGDKPYSTAWTLLRESPHAARHLRRLHCLLPDEDAAPEQVDALLCAILNNLSNVRHCYFVGATGDLWTWPSTRPQLSLAIFEFIKRQKLAQLHVLAIHALPRAILALFLGAAPSLSIVEVSIDLTTPS